MESLAALLDRVAEVCPLPTTAQRILELCQSEQASVPDLTKVIGTDPALASAVLRIANSAAYGGRGIDQLAVAVMRIGLRELRDMAAAMCLLAAFRSRAELTLRLHDQSVLSGSIASDLAKQTGVVARSTAFVAGLLCEIGAMAWVSVEGKPYVAIWQEAAGSEQRRLQLERDAYAFTSLELGEQLLARNGLPEAVSAAVGSALDTSLAEKPDLSKIVVLARRAAAELWNAGIAPPKALEAELAAFASTAALSGIDGRVLLEVSTQAGIKAQQALRETR